MGTRDLLLKFRDPSIYPERLKLETSNLAGILATKGPKQIKLQNWVKGVVKGSRDLLLKFWNSLHISGTVVARNFKIWHTNWKQGVLTIKMQN